MRDNAKQFAKKIVFMVKDIRKEHRDVVLTGQLLRSGTSIGANIHEASYAQGRTDFVSKLEIALKKDWETIMSHNPKTIFYAHRPKKDFI